MRSRGYGGWTWPPRSGNIIAETEDGSYRSGTLAKSTESALWLRLADRKRFWTKADEEATDVDQITASKIHSIKVIS